MTQPLSIVVDIDDTAIPWYDDAHRASERAGITNGIVPVTWTPWVEYRCEPEQWWEALRVATYDGTLYVGVPDPADVAALWRLEHAGHFIHLVTARGTHPSLTDEMRELIQAATHRQIAEHFIPHDSLTFSHDKTVVPADYAVDDNLANYDALGKAGVLSFLVNRPWNAPHDDGRRRVDSLAAFAAIILGD